MAQYLSTDPLSWDFIVLYPALCHWKNQQHQLHRLRDATHPYWAFWFESHGLFEHWIEEFVTGDYRFGPMICCRYKHDQVIVWSFRDRLFLKALLNLIKPTFPAIIHPHCVHLKGPSRGVQQALDQLKRHLDSGQYEYFIRLDIKQYYASIDRRILTEQVKDCFDDPRVIHYLTQIIYHDIEDSRQYITPNRGIPLRSSLSPFFAALYLKPLDEAFSGRDGVFYVRFVDDVFMLFRSKRSYHRAKRRMYRILRALKLQCSPNKTAQGQIVGKVLHFLGVEFQVERKTCDTEKPSQEAQNTLDTRLKTRLHSRTIHRRAKKTQSSLDLGAGLKVVQRGLRLSAAQVAPCFKHICH